MTSWKLWMDRIHESEAFIKKEQGMGYEGQKRRALWVQQGARAFLLACAGLVLLPSVSFCL